jgi:hypothetical protein
MVDQHIFFHPDFTVGPGVSPDLLTLHAQALAGYYRRWGVAPRPEDVCLTDRIIQLPTLL